MIKNYFERIGNAILCLGFILGSNLAFSQELRIFTLKDFDLRGEVKFCQVITDYGKEEYDFNKAGLLTKSVTRHSEKDYAITYYKYDKGYLVEKRVERYFDGVFDKNTSMANIYEIDTTSQKRIKEQIVSYSQDFIDQYEYIFDDNDQLITIIRTNNNGTDETRIDYSTYKDETTVSYFLNDVIQKSVRTSQKTSKSSSSLIIKLTKQFLDGEPIKAIEQQFNDKDILIREEHFEFDTKSEAFASKEIVIYNYNEDLRLTEVYTKKGVTAKTEKYNYQLDQAKPESNWVKKIISPTNTYTTRRLMYYNTEVDTKEQ